MYMWAKSSGTNSYSWLYMMSARACGRNAVLFVSKAATPTKWMVTLQEKSQNSYFQMQDKLTAAQTPAKDK